MTWNASLIMDAHGNIGMGYSGMTLDPNDPNPVEVSSFYTGRFAADPVNTMTITEQLIANGNANIPGFRYGDYGKIDIDPLDDRSFWYITEYMNNGRKDVVGVFRIAPVLTTDVGAVLIESPNDGPLTANETVTVTLFNFGQQSQTNFPVNLTIDGTTVATENFTGTITSATSASFTFAATVDLSIDGQTYELEVSTNLAGDEDTDNDTVTKNVTHVFANDLGVVSILEPVSGEGLGDETVTITIRNFGANQQSNFDVSYTINGGAAVTETVAGPIGPGATQNYSFSTTADLSVIGSYEFIASTQLGTDADASNDSTTKTVMNLILDFDDNFADNAELVVLDRGNKQFKLLLPTTEITEMLTFSVINMLGQTLASYRLHNEDGTGYEYDLDMSYVRLGSIHSAHWKQKIWRGKKNNCELIFSIDSQLKILGNFSELSIQKISNVGSVNNIVHDWLIEQEQE